MTLQPYPANLGTGIVVGRFGLTGTDPDEYEPATGLTVTFTPMAPAVSIATATPSPLSLAMVEKVCGIDPNGFLAGPDGVVGVTLIATNDADTNPTEWSYFVTFQLDGQEAPFKDFAMAVMAGQTIDLADVMPTPVTPGISLPAVQAAEASALAARDTAVASAASATASAASISGSVATAAASASAASASAASAAAAPKWWSGTQTAYAALPTKDSTVLYLITGP